MGPHTPFALKLPADTGSTPSDFIIINKLITVSWFPVSNSNHQLNKYCEHQTKGNDAYFRLLIIKKNIWDQY